MGHIPGGHPKLRSDAEELLMKVESLLGLSAGPAVERLRNALQRPVVIVVAGRVNTGKSTLVNSLISVKLAPTSAQETTSLVCCYAYSAPARAEAVLRSAEVVPIPLGPSGPALEDVSKETVDYLRVYVQAAALQPVTIIDTPGLGSAMTNNSARSESWILGKSDMQDVPDAMLYLVRDNFRPDDADFIARFRAHSGRDRERETAPVIGLVAHADNHAGGAWHNVEPVDTAKADAVKLAGETPQLDAVLPISALLAETVRTGALRERDVRNLRFLTGCDDTRLQFAEYLGPPDGVTTEDFRRLLALVGPYGIRYGREHAGSAAQLMDWLYERSGLAGLEEILQIRVMVPAECARVEEMLSGLTAAARSLAWPPQVRALIESARHAPAFHRLQEESALALLRESAPGHEFIAVLEDLRQPDWRPPASTSAAQWSDSCLQLASRYQAKAGTAKTGAEARAARVIARSFLIRSSEARTSA
ncbi:hypothetical protein J2T22_000040 [Pseudarthrobacter defluvii]|uniref:Dynamin N-terminal domain-containing protein n=1 Tax=Pseudarthrobacter defluvii TaxID=410837 RepID=A0ABT9UB65_9MICC|nr:dynamin family protein [Pseudarthrobacter defluvii]MDQ0116880.1 hypothetical protein [Pseudarthrobacter defluvii]